MHYTTCGYALKIQRPADWLGYDKVQVTRLNPSLDGPKRGKVIKGRYIYAFERVQLPEPTSPDWPLVWINGTAYNARALREMFAKYKARIAKGLPLYS